MKRIVMNLDHDWRFHSGDIVLQKINSHAESYGNNKAGAARGPAGKNWQDSDWRIVDLPHDYYAESDFSPDNLLSHGYRRRSNAWYRKSFLLDESLSDRELFICFEGTAVNAEFYFNGSLIERSFSAYTETFFNITDRAYFDGRPNVLAVYIKGFETEGWWYEGAGIYRHVRLYAKDKLHIAHNGIFGKPKLIEGTKNSWTVEVETTLENSAYEEQTASVHSVILDGDKVIAEQTTSDITCIFDSQKAVMQKLKVSRPTRWDVDNPKLYTLRVEVIRDGKVVDEETARIGFRTFSIDAAKGFFLNGRPLKIKGTCNHQDHAGVGVAIPDSVQYYRIKRLKELGSNAYRCAHNLPAKEVLDACDELGLIVMDENRRFESRREVLEYIDIMVKRDRNHPSVIFWSLFNEEPLQNTEEGAKIYRRMRSRVLHLDDSRLLTGAINGSMEGAGMEMDVTGINYGIGAIDAMHNRHPEQPIIGSENNSAVTTRGCYKSDREGAQVLACYDDEKVPWGQTIRETWDFVRNHDYFAGIFIWTGFDYRGEPTPFIWPSVSSQFGIMDTCGFAKDSFYFNKACFTDQPMVHLLPHWNHQKGDCVRVMAVSNCEEVELFLNGKSLGRKPADVCAPPEWQVAFAPGRLSAKAYRKGRCVAKDEVRTAGKPYAIRICPDSNVIKNDGADTAIVNCCVVDKKGVVVPTANDLLRFEVIGDGYVRGVGNGDPNSHESDVLPERKAYCGYCQVLITSRMNGEQITLRVWSEGLEEATLTFEVEKVAQPLCPRNVLGFMLGGFTVSAVSEHKPDPLVELADNDMNSFVPVQFMRDTRQSDFRHGWRIYRTTPKIFKKGTYKIGFSNILFSYAEIYVNGRQIGRVEKPIEGKYETQSFEITEELNTDIRILLYADTEEAKGAGIAGIVELKEAIDSAKVMEEALG